MGTPIVPIAKADGSLRICGDYKVTVNPHIIVDCYPLPRTEYLINSAQGNEYYSKFDMREAYTQVRLDEASKEILTLSTHKGSIRPSKLMYGIACAPGSFQRQIEQILNKIPNVYVFRDDIYVTSKTVKENYVTFRKRC